MTCWCRSLFFFFFYSEFHLLNNETDMGMKSNRGLKPPKISTKEVIRSPEKGQYSFVTVIVKVVVASTVVLFAVGSWPCRCRCWTLHCHQGPITQFKWHSHRDFAVSWSELHEIFDKIPLPKHAISLEHQEENSDISKEGCPLNSIPVSDFQTKMVPKSHTLWPQYTVLIYIVLSLKYIRLCILKINWTYVYGTHTYT